MIMSLQKTKISNLPPRPKKIKRKEAAVTPFVIRWFAANWGNSCAIEVKVKGNTTIKHQNRNLKRVANGSFSYKIPDMGQKSCYDAFVLKNADAFVVTCEKRICKVYDVKKDSTFTIKV